MRMPSVHGGRSIIIILQQDPESLIHNLDLINLVPCELGLTSTPFCDANIITYGLELPPAGNKIGFNLLDGGDFTTLYILHRLFINLQHRLRRICVSFLSESGGPSHQKGQ